MDTVIQRLRLAREVRQLSLAETARGAGYAVSTLSNVELGRDKPSAELIIKVCDFLEADPVWIETGKGPMFRQNSRAAKLHLEVWASNTRRRIEDLRIQGKSKLEEADRLAVELEKVETALKSVAEGTHKLTLRLTDVFPEYKYREMQARLPELIRHLKELTEGPENRGKKTELAEFLGVPLSRVSNWLAQRKKPGGETTLRLLKWAEEQAAKTKKGPGSGDTPPEPKAQSRKSSHENRKPGPE